MFFGPDQGLTCLQRLSADDTLWLQCYSVLSDILVKNELCILLKMFYLLVKVSFAYLLPVSLKLLCYSVLSTKKQFPSVP